MDKNARIINDNLCKDCIYRFRRVFIPHNIEDYKDEEDDGLEILEDGDENIVIMNMCIVSDMDLSLDSTVDCSHYQSKSEVNLQDQISIFKHLHKRND